MPKPRRFQHRFIYVDERKDRLRAMEERIRKEASIEKLDDDKVRERLHDSFRRNMRHVTRRNDYHASGCLYANIGIVVILIFILVVVWRLLLNM